MDCVVNSIEDLIAALESARDAGCESVYLWQDDEDGLFGGVDVTLFPVRVQDNGDIVEDHDYGEMAAVLYLG